MGLHLEVVSEGVTGALVRLDGLAVGAEVDSERLARASDVVYEATDSWFSSHGEGRWPPLAASTLAGKRRRGFPDDPLVETGAFKDSVTSAHGPLSFHMSAPDGVVFGVDWDRGGWQIPVVHFYGTHNAGVDHDVVIPARPAWPAHDSVVYAEMRARLTELMFRGA